MNNEIKEILDYLDYGVNSLSISKPPFKIEYEDIKKLFDYIANLEQQCKKQKELIDKIKNCFDNGHFEDSCDCLIIEKYIDSYFEEVSE